MQYAQKKFNVMMPGGSSDDLAKRWEDTFGKKADREPAVANPPAVIVPPVPRETVAVSGLWFRSRDQSAAEVEADKAYGLGKIKWTVLEVLVEIDGIFRLVQTHRVPDIGETISHITETLGLRRAPEDHR